MRIVEGFVVCHVGGKTVAVASGALCKRFNGMITLNSTGQFLFEKLKKNTDEEELANALVEEYSVSYEDAMKDVKTYLGSLDKAGLLIYE